MKLTPAERHLMERIILSFQLRVASKLRNTDMAYYQRRKYRDQMVIAGQLAAKVAHVPDKA